MSHITILDADGARRDVATVTIDGVDVQALVDDTPGYVQLPGGTPLTLDAGQATQALAAYPGRIKAVLTPYDMNGGRLWVRFDGTDAAPGCREVVYEGQQWWEYTTAAVSVYFEGTGTCGLAWSELGT